VIAIIPVTLLVPAAFVRIPPAVMLVPAPFSRIAEFPSLMLGLAAISPMVLHRLVEIMFGVFNAPLAPLVDVFPRLRESPRRTG
jgi:hypothetical protein